MSLHANEALYDVLYAPNFYKHVAGLDLASGLEFQESHADYNTDHVLKHSLLLNGGYWK